MCPNVSASHLVKCVFCMMILLAEMKHIQRLDAMEIQKSSSVKGALRPLTREPRSNRIEQILLAENDK